MLPGIGIIGLLSRQHGPENTRMFVGEAMFNTWVEYKTEEWLRYNNHVSDWEKTRYLKLF